MTYKPFDTEIQALHGKIKHHLSHTYKSTENEKRNLQELNDEYARVSKFPLNEITGHIWDSMNFLAAKAGIHGASDPFAETE